MNVRGRIRRLEASAPAKGAEPTLEAYLAEARTLDAWLAQRGLTPHQALAAQLDGPPGLRWASVALVEQAEEDLTVWQWASDVEAAAHCEARAGEFTPPGYQHIAEQFRADAARWRARAE